MVSMPTMALEIGADAGDGWINAVAKTRYPYGPEHVFEDIPLSTEKMPVPVWIIYFRMPDDNAVAAYMFNQWQKWLKKK